MNMQNVKHVYDFPNAKIATYRDGTCREFPKWCLQISTERPRSYVANALRMLRQHKRGRA